MSGRKTTPDIMGDLLNGTVARPEPQAFDLIVPTDFDYDQWVEFGGRIAAADAKIRFVIGDWIIAGDRKWGDIYADAARITGKNEKYLRDCVWVSGAFQLSERSDNLSWSHHWRLASADEDQRPHFMETVEGEGLSVRETKTLIDESKIVDGDAAGQHTSRGTCKRCHRPLTAGQSVVNGMGPCCAAKAARAASIEDAKDDNLGPSETFSVWVERDYEDQIADLDNFLGRNFPDFTDREGDTVTIAIDVMRWMMNEINREDGTR